MKRFILIIISVLPLVFAGGFSKSSKKSSHSLSKIEDVIKAGVTTKQQIKALFGSPSKVADVDPSISQGYEGYIWDYYESGYSRFSF